MKYKLAEDTRPQVTLLFAATAVSVVLWMIAWYVPLVGYVVYPLQLFATFVHESSHALMTLITGNAVMSLTVSPDASGVAECVPNSRNRRNPPFSDTASVEPRFGDTNKPQTFPTIGVRIRTEVSASTIE